MTLTSALTTILPLLVLLAFAVIIYAGFTHQKIGDLIKDLLGKLKRK